MKKIVLILLCLLVPTIVFAGVSDYLRSVAKKKSVTVTGGFVGTKDGTLNSTSTSSNRASYYSEFTADPGPVNYMYINLNRSDLATVDMRLSIWNTSGELQGSTDCTLTNVSGTLYRAQLTAELVLTATNYWVGWTYGQSYVQTLYTSSTSGTAENGGAYFFNECPTDAHVGTISNSSTESATYTWAVWASNSAGDTHE